MPPVSIADSIGRDSNLRGHRLVPVLLLRVAENIPVVEDQRFEGHASINVSAQETALVEIFDQRSHFQATG